MGASGAVCCAGRALRLLLLLVMTLAAVEYFTVVNFRTIRTSLRSHPYNTKAVSSSPVTNSTTKHSHPTTKGVKNTTTTTMVSNVTKTDKRNNTSSLPTLLITKIMNGIKDLVTTEDSDVKNNTVPLCDAEPPDLGPITVNKTIEMELRDVLKKYREVFWGGCYAPPNCTARHKVAIIVPYRDRQQHLAIFLNHMHQFLMKQQLEYGIFIIEQKGTREFNRGKLFNVGFVEAQRLRAGGWQCFVFHDVDLLPLDERNLYSCPRRPRHMSIAIDINNFKVLYELKFGGVSAMTKEQFLKVNGFSNKYWGWGGEDDDMYYRIIEKKYNVAKYKLSIARYAMLHHKQQTPNPLRYQLLSQRNSTIDGLSSLDYDTLEVVQHHLYTHITVNIDDHTLKTNSGNHNQNSVEPTIFFVLWVKFNMSIFVSFFWAFLFVAILFIICK